MTKEFRDALRKSRKEDDEDDEDDEVWHSADDNKSGEDEHPVYEENRGMSLQLGYFLGASSAVGQILFPSDNHVTIWIHNDNAIQLSGANFNHYSGVGVLDSVLPAGFDNMRTVTSDTEPVVWNVPETVTTENVWGNDDAIAPGFQFEDKTEEAQEDPVGNAKVAWTAG
ncbi:uncharacterized protein FTOL_03451 [Fusarium torulosum]|uniref:Uncharacterized protein n=1 Tax=Fusarium torulosum TaxID=33205 RepID=A0AAE8M3L4_9HYPO|nr:uncharacterized protein FTOL_03451 [Fusarium torulosum]